ncbi:tyrosine-protein phosphatase non-receptor type 61F isoform X1 [Musca domestica]|uniref:protein-tyrosine-phosphatase n=1 Tax=Musca domestica TaxID=7370 RepID=A0A1I8MBM4_MUSDO|nr:tyrosine-protein phosphatase non-receptor type 61F isoform X1 [Musca domestica]
MTSTTNSTTSSGGGSESSNETTPLESSSSSSSTSSTASASVPNNIELEYNKISKDRNGWQRLYQEIRERCEREANEKHFCTSESEKSHNRCLNRYRDVNPYDHSRIILHRGSVDYINANLVKMGRAERKYILTQGPLVGTIGHFWLMVWEQKSRAILMLNKLMEKKQPKCHLYWPERKGPENALKLNEVKLTVEFLHWTEYKNFCVRWFKLTDLQSNQSRNIIQFHYTTWPDFGVPSSPVAFLYFLKEVRASGALDPNEGPAVVHCSAGIGRSGTFCLVDCCLVLVDKEGVNNVSVQDVLYELRRYRMGLIQTADQLYFSYQAIIEGIKLLKDQNFMNYNEVVYNSVEDHCQQNDEYNLDETPPPLPPRTHSLLPMAGSGADGSLRLNLMGNNSQNKPLPKIPASVSFNDDLYAPDNDKTNKDALNNFINSERNTDATNMTHRPLPPLPRENSLDRVHESDSDENEYDEDDRNDENDNEDHIVAEAEANENGTATKHNHSKSLENENKDQDSKKLNGVESTDPVSPDNELRRRKRAERQANIEQKVNEIKRKQRENEENKQTAKKRRSIITYITAGVVVGVICVYVYSKWA